MYYGATTKNEITITAIKVVECLGGGEPAINLLIGTCCAETLLGAYRNKIQYNYGVGLCQFDKVGFKDTKDRASKVNKNKVLECFNIDLDKVEYRELAYSPLLSLIFCRLFYILKPGKIPETLEGQAEYWKKHYNTVKGAGSVKEYIEKFHSCV